MNIVIIGPGTDINKLGGFFLNRARKDGHNVRCLSHKQHNSVNTSDHRYVDFLNPDSVTTEYMSLISDLDRIDLLLYNSNSGGGPGSPDAFHSNAMIDVFGWNRGIHVHCISLNIIVSKSLSLMDKDSKVVFMSSSASYLINRDNYLHLAAYFGFKGIQNQMMRGYAEYNDKNAVFSTYAPHIPYEDNDTSNKIMNQIYTRALDINLADNGKIIQFYPPEGDPHYHD